MSEEAQQITDNPVLQDIADIKLSRPDLTAEQWEAVEKAAPYYKALLRPEVRQEMEVDYAGKYDEFVSKARVETQQAVAAKFEEWKKTQEPLNTDELKKLLSQEYIDIKFDIPTEEGGTKHFVIRELPKSVEKRFIAVVKRTLLPLLEERALAGFKWGFDSTMADKINAILDLVPNSMDMAAEIAAVCLDPLEKDKTITADWVSSHLSMSKIQAVVLLQFEANKYRDFFLHGLRLFQSLSSRTTI
jgi:hypothetical protein